MRLAAGGPSAGGIGGGDVGGRDEKLGLDKKKISIACQAGKSRKENRGGDVVRRDWGEKT